MTVKFKLICSLAVLLLLTGLLSGCACQHQWQEATCMAPQTCAKCGEVQGKIRSHKWGNTDCKNPEPCVYCGTLEGIGLTHQWRSDCRICAHCGHDERPADDRFVDQLNLALEDRLTLTNRAEDRLREEWKAGNHLTDYSEEEWASFIEAEYTRLADFREETFLDPELGELAKRYVNCVVEAHGLIPTFGTEEWSNQYLNGVYQSQRETLFHLSNIRDITVSEACQPRLEKLLRHGEIIQMANQLFDQVMFLNIRTKENEWTYETTVTNTSSLTFKYFTFEIDLLDEEGNCLVTETATVENWDPEEKVRFNFTTAQLFHAMRVDSANWEIE